MMFNQDLYNTPYHNVDISKFKFLITGGAGFIGSNIVEYLLKYNAGHVRVLDDLSNGYYENIKDFVGHPNFEFVEGDIRDFETCRIAITGMDFISHQAALGSVPRSINDPVRTNEVNINGFLNMLVAAKDSLSLKKMVYAASSSTYGDSPLLPKIEGNEGNPLSPYAVSKVVNELYADVFSRVYDFHSIGLRYFNIFGPKQNQNNPYAAVIPIFCKAFINNTRPRINGDGHTSRDFTFVENAVQANIRALLSGCEDSGYLDNNQIVNRKKRNLNKQNCEVKGQIEKHAVFNVACGDQFTLNEIIELLHNISGKNISPEYGPERKGDVKHSKASIEKISRQLKYLPNVRFEEGLKIVFDWYKKVENKY